MISTFWHFQRYNLGRTQKLFGFTKIIRYLTINLCNFLSILIYSLPSSLISIPESFFYLIERMTVCFHQRWLHFVSKMQKMQRKIINFQAVLCIYQRWHYYTVLLQTKGNCILDRKCTYRKMQTGMIDSKNHCMHSPKVTPKVV